jgi:hypothetical protein
MLVERFQPRPWKSVLGSGEQRSRSSLTCRMPVDQWALERGVVEVRVVAGKFEVYEDRAGKYRFRLKASNGEVVAS